MDFTYPWQFTSRRSAVMAPNGMVATSQPLAARAGLRVLEHGGTAADAAVTTAAVLNVVEPHMTGIGGDAFALTCFDGTVEALNASGPAPAAASIDEYRDRLSPSDGDPEVPAAGGLAVTVPGALDGWKRLLDRHGVMTLAEAIEPAIEYAETGFPVTEFIADQWSNAADRLRQYDVSAATFLPNGTPPEPGQRFANPAFANTLDRIATEGIDVFYGGEIGEAVVETVRDAGGVLALSDLEAYESEWTDPIATEYRGVEVLEHPPNGQGAIALEALNVAETVDLPADPADPDRLHALIEATKIAFADGYATITDPAMADVPLETMLSKEYARDRAAEIDHNAGSYNARADTHGDTVYLTVVDGEGNAVSFINSLYFGFGSALTTAGFALHNRGHSFSLDSAHANALAPGKRPFHTIIPAMLREDGEFRASWGLMGGDMQPQGHLQVMAALVDSGLNPQAALDVPRFRWQRGRDVGLETNRLSDAVVEDLRERGHRIVEEDAFYERGGHFGSAQFIYQTPDGGLIGGSDPRRDGLAIGY